MAETSPGGGLFLPSCDSSGESNLQPLHSPRSRQTGYSPLHDFKRRRCWRPLSPQSVGTRPTTADSDRGGGASALGPQASWLLPSSASGFGWGVGEPPPFLGGDSSAFDDGGGATRTCSSPQQQQHQWDSGGSSSTCLSYLQQQQQRLARLRKPPAALSDFHLLQRPLMKRKSKHTSQGTYAQQARAACRITSSGPMLPANGPLVARSVQPRSEAERQARCLLRRRAAAAMPCGGVPYLLDEHTHPHALPDPQYWPPPQPPEAYAPAPSHCAPPALCSAQYFPSESDPQSVPPPPPPSSGRTNVSIISALPPSANLSNMNHTPNANIALHPRLIPPLMVGPSSENYPLARESSGAVAFCGAAAEQQQQSLPGTPSIPLPRSANARAAISSYPFPPAPLALLPKLRNARHQQLFREYLKVVHDPMRVQLGHFLIEHCLRSLPDEFMKADAQPDPSLIVEFGDQIITAVRIFGHETHYGTAQDTIPSDINETYIFNWIHQNRALLRPLELLLEDRRRGAIGASSYCYRSSSSSVGGAGDDHHLYTNRKRRGSSAVDSTDFYERHAVPSAINCENLPSVIANAGLLVRLPHQSFTQCRRDACFRCSQQPHSNHKNHLLFNLLIAGRGDTRRCRMQMPWGELMYIKYNRTLLGIPDFVVSCLGFGAGTSGVQVIPKVCAVSLEEAPAGVEILLLYRGLPCVKKKLQSVGRYIAPWGPPQTDGCWQHPPNNNAAPPNCHPGIGPLNGLESASTAASTAASAAAVNSGVPLHAQDHWMGTTTWRATETSEQCMTALPQDVKVEVVAPSSFERQQHDQPSVQYEEQELQSSEKPCPLSPASALALQTWSSKVRLRLTPPSSPCQVVKPTPANCAVDAIAMVDYSDDQPSTPPVDLWKATDCDPSVSPESCGLCDGSVDRNQLRVKVEEKPLQAASALWPVFVPSP